MPFRHPASAANRPRCRPRCVSLGPCVQDRGPHGWARAGWGAGPPAPRGCCCVRGCVVYSAECTRLAVEPTWCWRCSAGPARNPCRSWTVDAWGSGRLAFSSPEVVEPGSQLSPRQSGGVVSCSAQNWPDHPPAPVPSCPRAWPLGYTVQWGREPLEAQCLASAGWSPEAPAVSHPVAGWSCCGRQPQPCCPWQPLGGSKDHPGSVFSLSLPGVAWSPGAGGADPLGLEVRWQWGPWSALPAPLPQAFWWLLLHPSQGWSEEGIMVLSPEECLASWGTWMGKRQSPHEALPSKGIVECPALGGVGQGELWLWV